MAGATQVDAGEVGPRVQHLGAEIRNHRRGSIAWLSLYMNEYIKSILIVNVGKI
jgi:hypothetical protein